MSLYIVQDGEASTASLADTMARAPDGAGRDWVQVEAADAREAVAVAQAYDDLAQETRQRWTPSDPPVSAEHLRAAGVRVA